MNESIQSVNGRRLPYARGPIKLAPISRHVHSGPGEISAAEELGFYSYADNNLMTFAMNHEFAKAAEANDSVRSVIVGIDLAKWEPERSDLEVIVVDDAKLRFYQLHNSLRSELRFGKSTISSRSEIHPSAVISDHGVEIGDDCVIEPGVVIGSGTTLGNRVIVRAGTCLGSDALDIRRTHNSGMQMTDHLGGVIVADDVEIGHGSVVDRAIFRQSDTVIGESTKVGCLSNISHGVVLGAENIIAGGVLVCGSTKIGNNNWIGPGAIISNLLSIGDDNFIAIGSHVLRSFGSGRRVVGNKVLPARSVADSIPT